MPYLSALVEPIRIGVIIPFTVLLIFIGMLLVLWQKGRGLEDEIRASSAFILEIDPGLSLERKQSIKEFLSVQEGIDNSSVNFIERTEALEFMLGEFPELDEWPTQNPFYDIYVFNVLPEYHSKEYLVQLKEQVETLQGVRSIFYDDQISNGLDSIVTKLSWILVILAIVLAGMVILLFQSIIRADLATERTKIKLMELVGATPDFIKRPFVKAAVHSAVVSTFMATLILVSGMLILNHSAFKNTGIPGIQIFFAVLGMVAVGFIVSVGGTNIILNLYLKDYYKQS